MERRFLTNKNLINNKASGESIYITDSAEEKLNNLIIYGKTTQAAEPTLEAPQELVSVGAKPFNVYVTGNNLFKPYAITAANIVYTDASNPSDPVIKSDYGVKINSTTYNNEIGIIAYQEDTKADNKTPVANFIDGYFCMYFDSSHFQFDKTYTFIADVEVLENKSPTGNMQLRIDASSGNKFITLKSNKEKICFPIKVTINPKYPERKCIQITVYGKSLSLKNIMWLPGDWTTKPPEYEDYKEQVLTLSEELKGIPVSSGGNFTDDNKQWICDKIDFSKGYKYDYTSFLQLEPGDWDFGTFSGGESSNTEGYKVFTKKYYPYSSGSTFMPPAEGKTPLLCKYFSSVSGTFQDISGMWIDTETVTNGLGIKDLVISINIIQSDTLRDTTALDKFLTNNIVEVLYAIRSYRTTKLSDEEIAAYQSLKTNYPITRVINGVDAGMEIDYTCDTKNYIDNKLANLVALALEV